MDFIRRRQLRVYFVSRDDYADRLHFALSERGIAEVDYLAYSGYAASVSTLIVALSGPVLGTLADYQGLKKKYLRCA